MAKKVPSPGGHPPIYTGKGTHGTGLGYHGKPRGATKPAKGMGYHGHPPHPHDHAAKGPQQVHHSIQQTSSSGKNPKPMPKRGPK